MENSLFQFNGDVTIGTAIAEAGTVDASIGKTINQQEIQARNPQEDAANTPEIKAGLLHLNPNVKNIDMYIIIYGMWKAGMFVREDGTTNAKQGGCVQGFRDASWCRFQELQSESQRLERQQRRRQRSHGNT